MHYIAMGGFSSRKIGELVMIEDRKTTGFSAIHRNPEGGTPELEEWGINSEYGVLRDVLVGPVETFGPMDNVEFSSIYRNTKQRDLPWDQQTAIHQYKEICDANKDACVNIHTLPIDEHLKYGI